MKQFKDRTAIVTGATKGIGKAICLALAAQGANIASVSHTGEGVADLEAQITGLGSQNLHILADLTKEEEINAIPRETLRAFGRIDILVNNAGFIHPSVNLVDAEAELWRHVLNLNLIAPALLMKAVLPTMMGQRSGKIINISSIGGRKGGKGRSPYRASKAGLINLCESAAAEVKPHNIDVNCICPSATDTEGYRENIDPHGGDQDPRVMRPQQIADVVVFLASDASSAITGTCIDAFGGTNPLFS